MNGKFASSRITVSLLSRRTDPDVAEEMLVGVFGEPCHRRAHTEGAQVPGTGYVSACLVILAGILQVQLLVLILMIFILV